MTTLPIQQLKPTIFCVFFLFLQSCVVTPGTWKNDRISSNKREDFHRLNNEALKYLKANDANALKAILSKEMNAENNIRKIELISNRLTDNDYTMLDEYYVVHKYKDTDTISVKATSDINRYGLLYPYAAPEMYMAYFIPKKPDNKYMISLAYAKFNYGWKIVEMSLSPYTINGKTAPQLYAMARAQYDKGQVQAAFNNVSLAMSCFEPGVYWKYPDEVDARKLYSRLMREVNIRYSYPLVLRQITTGPMVLRIYTQSKDDGIYPMVYYMTHFNIKDTSEVKKENLQVRKALAKLMPGMEQNNKYILYSAFNKQPNGYTSVDHFEMIQKIN